MKGYLKILLFACLSLNFYSVVAQPSVFQPGDYKDGVYEKENSINRRLIPYTHLREGDVMWEKRVWRVVDMREKLNQQLYFPLFPNASRISLMQLLAKYILSGQIIAFKDDEFLVPFEKAEIRDKMVIPGVMTDVTNIDSLGNEVITQEMSPADSTWLFNNFNELHIKEDWFFDKQKSVLEVRILSMGVFAPMPNKEEAGPIKQFYVYYPACRPYFAKHEVYNAKNDSERRTFEDIFWKRQFASTVKKESNVYDRDIEFYSKGIDALLESDRIKADIFRYEHDLWQF